MHLCLHIRLRQCRIINADDRRFAQRRFENLSNGGFGQFRQNLNIFWLRSPLYHTFIGKSHELFGADLSAGDQLHIGTGNFP